MAAGKETGGRFDLVSQSVSGGLLMVSSEQASQVAAGETGGRPSYMAVNADLSVNQCPADRSWFLPSRQVEPVLREQKPPTYLAAGSILSVNQCPVDTD